MDINIIRQFIQCGRVYTSPYPLSKFLMTSFSWEILTHQHYRREAAILRKFGPRCLTSKSQNPSFIYDVREGIFPKENGRIVNPSSHTVVSFDKSLSLHDSQIPCLVTLFCMGFNSTGLLKKETEASKKWGNMAKATYGRSSSFSLGYRIRSLSKKINETQGLWKTVGHTNNTSACFWMNA